MKNPYTFRLLASTNNDKGDLFTRLVSDLFYALGYDKLRFDVHKTGCEIDIEGEHRREKRRVIAECKAHKKKIGGADLNKLLGILTRERGKKENVAGYFLSLGGFSESSLEQERNTIEENQIITIDANGIVKELIDANMLIPEEKACERAGRCAEFAKLSGATFGNSELLGHNMGYVWAVYYCTNKNKTHYALIYADGTPLAQSEADKIVQIDQLCGGELHKLSYLSPPKSDADRKTLIAESIQQYRNWLATECGYIQLDGLPADADLTALRMRMEKLFVPLKITYKKNDKPQVTGVGDHLRKHSRFSILAKPGGGKSTLLKRIAVAYADPDRRKESADNLPNKTWLPLFLRCRELRDRVDQPFRQLLGEIGRHAEMSDEQSNAFREHLDETLKSGKILLLIDGLDEISEAGARATFANHLRTFLGMFPNVSLIVTSREAGFRQIAGVIASICEETTMAPFDEADVQILCQRWHAEVVGDNVSVREESAHLANTIWENGRIRPLAENPLMLTTLLVVKRNVGELPTKRVKLYQAAVDVLTRTWNVEGFEPLDEEETLARLSYVAVAMMQSGEQQIGRRQLLKLLKNAQEELEVELQFAKISPNQFIDRIEYRSSLLMQTGHEDIDGHIQEVFEFRHLTFQEYLAARGLVEEHYSDRDTGKSLTELLKPHFKDATWREVIPLAAVLADRKEAESLIIELTSICEASNPQHNPHSDESNQHANLIRHCLLDEIQIKPDTLRAALSQGVRLVGRSQSERAEIVRLAKGKFGNILSNSVKLVFFEEKKYWDQYSRAVEVLVSEWLSQEEPKNIESKIFTALRSDDRVERAFGIIGAMKIYFDSVRRFRDQSWEGEVCLPKPLSKSQLVEMRRLVTSSLSENDLPLGLCSAWNLAWSGEALPDEKPDKELIFCLYNLCKRTEYRELSRFAGWAITSQPLLPRDALSPCDWKLQSLAEKSDADNETRYIPFLIAWYKDDQFSNDELLIKIRDLLIEQDPRALDNYLLFLRMLALMGDAGKSLIDELAEKHIDKGKYMLGETRQILGIAQKQ